MTGRGRGPAVARRQLRLKLRRARRELDKTQSAVADALDWSPSKIMRIEKGETAVAVSDLIALLTEYPNLESDREALIQLARESKSPPAVNKYGDALTPQFSMWLDFEASADSIRQFEPMLVPGALQTDDYARASVHNLLDPQDPRDPRRIVASRRERIDLLMRSDGPPMQIIIDEAALHRAVGNEDGGGGYSIIRDQLTHIKLCNSVGRRALDETIESDRNPGVSVQIAPLTSGIYRMMRQPFEIIEFGGGDEGDQFMLYRELTDDEVFREDYDHIEKYLRAFDAFKKEIPQAIDTNRYLDHIIDQLPG